MDKIVIKQWTAIRNLKGFVLIRNMLLKNRHAFLFENSKYNQIKVYMVLQKSQQNKQNITKLFISVPSENHDDLEYILQDLRTCHSVEHIYRLQTSLISLVDRLSKISKILISTPTKDRMHICVFGSKFEYEFICYKLHQETNHSIVSNILFLIHCAIRDEFKNIDPSELKVYIPAFWLQNSFSNPKLFEEAQKDILNAIRKHLKVYNIFLLNYSDLQWPSSWKNFYPILNYSDIQEKNVVIIHNETTFNLPGHNTKNNEDIFDVKKLFNYLYNPKIQELDNHKKLVKFV